MNYCQSDRDQETNDWLNKDEDNEEKIEGQCPNCNYPLVDEMGVIVCYNCGWSNDPLI